MKNSVTIVLSGLIAIIVVYLIYRDFSHRENTFDKPEIRNEVVVSYGVPDLIIPDTVMFAGERVPLEIPDVKERLDRELHVNTFWHSNTIFLLKRGNRWLPSIGKVLEEYGVPSDMKYLAVIESDLLNKISPSNAVGFWQLLKGTAIDFKLEVNNEVDERYHPIKSTHAAAKYLVKAHEKFGTWSDAAASYNIGRRGLSRQMERQGVNSYYDLLLVEETERYLFRAIAIKLIFENPAAYGFNISQENLYPAEQFTELDVSSTISNLRDWAFENNINYKILKRFNPWLRKNTLTVRQGKSYIIQLPLNYPMVSDEKYEQILLMDTVGETDVRELKLLPEDGI